MRGAGRFFTGETSFSSWFFFNNPKISAQIKSRLNTSLHWQVNYSVLLQPLQNLLAENHFLQ